MTKQRAFLMTLAPAGFLIALAIYCIQGGAKATGGILLGFAFMYLIAALRIVEGGQR